MGEAVNLEPRTSIFSPADRAREALWKVQAGGLILLTFMSFFPRWFHAEEYLFFALLLVALGTAWSEGRTVWIRTPIDLPLLLFVAWVLLTVSFATDPAYSFAEWRKVAAQALVFYWAMLIFMTGDAPALTRGVLAAVVLGAAVLCTAALADFVARGGTWKDRVVRAGAPSSDYNWLATYLVIVIPLLIAIAVRLQAGWRRLGCWSLVVGALATQVFSYTRAGWLGMTVEAAAFGLMTGRRRLTMSVLGICAAIAVGLLAVSQFGYQRETVDSWTFKVRLAAWEAGLAEMLKHPVVGLGYGNNTFQPFIQGYPGGDRTMGLHSAFLMVGVGSGIPALVFLIWGLAKSVRVYVGRAKAASDASTAALMIGLAIMVVGFTVRNLFDYMFAGSLAALFWVLMATGLAQKPESRDRPYGGHE